MGSHTVAFNNISGWTAPSGQTANITTGTTTSLSGAYVQQTGSLTVTISPADAVTAGAMWNVDGGSWQASGTTVTAIAVGSHAVAFNNISGWTTPSSLTATISNGTTTSLSGAYVKQTGSLTVSISPAGAATAGAMWNVDGGSWQASGTTVSGITVGSHTVAFNNIAGWTTPSGQTATISNGTTTSLSGAYVQQTGSLTVTIGPAGAVSAGAMWNVDGGTTWYASGAVVPNLSVGSHTVAFNNISGWTTPSSQTANISNGTTASLSGAYVQQTGSLTVTISPAGALTAGAMWNVDGGSWQASGTIVSGITVGTHAVAFKDVAGWTTPSGQTANISNGTTTSLSGAYVQQTGSLTVTISPSGAVTAGAMWNVDGGTTWYASGAVVPNLSVGSHTVAFNNISAWTTPSSQTANITNGITASLSGTYGQQTGSLVVTISPAGAVTAGAMWNVDGGSTWYASSAVVPNLSVGSHTVGCGTSEMARRARMRTRLTSTRVPGPTRQSLLYTGQGEPVPRL